MSPVPLGLLCLGLAACDGRTLPTIDFERMLDQERYAPYAAAADLPWGRAMLEPPEGTVPHDRKVGDPALDTGSVGGLYAARIPIPLTRPLLDAGRTRFDIWCAACHGIRGDGESVVASKMPLRRPPNLLDERVRGFPPGRIYQVINEGYGLMRPYTEGLITPEERWSVVAYLRALQLSQGVPLSALPPAERARIEEGAP